MINASYGEKRLAIFDMDHTLVDADTPNLWFEYLIDQGHVTSESFRAQREHFNEQYNAGVMQLDDYIAFEVSMIQSVPLPTLEAWQEDFAKRYVMPKITQKAKDWVRLHRLAGDELILATASNHFIGQTVQQLLEFEHLIATNLAIKDGHFTGEIDGKSSYREGKLHRTQEWIAQNGGSLDQATFYSDSHNDLALLNAVRNPIAVDPDEKLLQVAEAQGWKVISKY